ncbi:hypothetical protein BESB_023720 [Besnoitia besnoiti]|uniref:Uncharacterized protein n=1 Tax=Besnoitia besnoiti TaxID=94643 RepID=A0A2A9M916_BESBE|nr:hypothetical protein BESB_023720 [Besnoitia besnoiti]PFH31880.1 hypothetical protein BESB_023720 [Besnoitia besnoiti]
MALAVCVQACPDAVTIGRPVPKPLAGTAGAILGVEMEFLGPAWQPAALVVVVASIYYKWRRVSVRFSVQAGVWPPCFIDSHISIKICVDETHRRMDNIVDYESSALADYLELLRGAPHNAEMHSG